MKDIKTTAKCEVCGKEIATNRPNHYTMFGQKVCSDKCLLEREEKKAGK